MMKNTIIALFAGICLLVSCETIDTVRTVDKDFVTNYEAFWNLVNENYCFLGTSYGNDKNVDWQAVYDKWMPIVKNEVKEEYELFNIIGKSLDELKDGHIWMESDFKSYSNDGYLLMPDGEAFYPENFISGFVQACYMNKSTGKDDYKGDKDFITVNGFPYGIIESNGKKIAYIYHGSYAKEFEKEDMAVLDPLVKGADALIYDIRNNPGGSGVMAITQGSLFFKEKQLIGYDAFKNGPGYDDFAEPTETYVIPADSYDWSSKPTALLINRRVYSAANFFTSIMSQAPNVILVGQISGGGGGLPMSHYLPNGWNIVFSSNIILGPDKKHIEGGIEPDFEAEIGADCRETRKDGVVEKAIEELLKKL
jgi:hypothetical protein